MMVEMEQLLCPVIVGRDREISLLVELVDAAAQQRRGGTVFLVGEAGVGKSRLARAARDAADARECRVLLGRAVPAGSPVPYRPLAEALHSVLRSGGLPDAPELQPFLPALGRLVPEWGLDAGQLEDSVVTRGEAVLRVLRVLGQDRGSLLVLEDLHWADADTLAVVEYLADNLAPEPVALVVTLRAEQSDALVLAHALRARHVAAVLAVEPLPDELVGDMAAACLGEPPPSDVEALLRTQADGLPFLVEELLAALVDTSALARTDEGWELRGTPESAAPWTFVQTVRQRLEGLDRDDRRVLAAAAVVGRSFDWTLLPAVTGLDQHRVVESLKAAVSAQLVSEPLDAPGQYRFRHALTREAVLDSLLSAERQLTARAALAAVHELHPDLGGDWCQLAADLARQAGDPRRSAELLLELGRRSIASGTIATGIQALDQAELMVPEDDALRIDIDDQLVAALAEAGEIERALGVGEVLAARMASKGVAAPRRATVHLVLATAASHATDWGLARSHVETAQRLLAGQPDDQLTSRTERLAGEIALGEYRLDDAVQHGQRALELAERHDIAESVCAALVLLGRCAAHHRPRRVRTALLQCRRASRRRSAAVASARTPRGGHARRPDDRRTRSVAGIAGACRVARAAQRGRVRPVPPGHRAFPPLRARRNPGTGASRPSRGPPLPPRPPGPGDDDHGCLDSRRAPGPPTAPTKPPRRCSRWWTTIPSSPPAPSATVSRWPRSRPTTGHAPNQELEAARAAIGDTLLAVGYPWRGLRVVLHALDGDRGALAHEERQVAPLLHHPIVRGYIELAEAIARGAAGDAATAAEQAARGDESLARTPWFRHVGRRLVAEAMTADGWGDPVPWLREATAFFDGHGNHVLAGACKTLLRDAGVPVPRRGRGSSTVAPQLQALGVTSREVDVLALVVQGLSNKEIAARLYLSPRTVEKHVERLVAKTGVAARHELTKYGADLS